MGLIVEWLVDEDVFFVCSLCLLMGLCVFCCFVDLCYYMLICDGYFIVWFDWFVVVGVKDVNVCGGLIFDFYIFVV